MNNKLETTYNSIVLKIVLTLSTYFLRFLQRLLLTSAVILPLIVLLFIATSINPDLSFGFFKSLAFLDPKYAKNNFNMNQDDLLKIILTISAVISLLSGFVQLLLSTIGIQLPKISKKIIALSTIVLVSLLYLVAVIITLVSPQITNSMILIFAIGFVFTIPAIVLMWIMEFVIKLANKFQANL